MRSFCFSLCLLFASVLPAQNALYYPPILSENWETVSPDSLGWCQDKIDSLIQFLDQKNSRSFIVLHQGRIAIEHYFGSFERDSIWYWASAGKSLVSFLVGMAQEEGLLSINDSTSQYLGTGWTDLTPQQEGAIRISHQLSMSTGLDDGVPNPDCLDDSCLVYLTDPGNRWAYHNAPYRLLQDVIANASGQNINVFTYNRLFNRIGMKGLWLNYIRYGRARDMARFGLLMLGRGVWGQDVLLSDSSYFESMITPSQNFNSSYGYLWWLNGQPSYMLPGLQLQIPGSLIPSAPADCYAALGKNDQKIYVVPSLDLVVVRQGDSAGDPKFALSSFDNQLWEHLSDVFCGNNTPIEEVFANREFHLYPNPARESIHLSWSQPLRQGTRLSVHNLMGQLVAERFVTAGAQQIDFPLAQLAAGIYTIQGMMDGVVLRERFVRE